VRLLSGVELCCHRSLQLWAAVVSLTASPDNPVEHCRCVITDPNTLYSNSLKPPAIAALAALLSNCKVQVKPILRNFDE